MERPLVSVHLPPLKKGGRGGFRTGDGAKIPPHPPLPKGGAKQLRSVIPEAVELRNTPGSGVEGWIEGRCYRVGQPEFVQALQPGASRPHPGDELEERSRGAERAVDAASTWVALGDETGLLAWFQLTDALRPGAAETVAALQNRGLTVELLSGDQPDTVARVAREVAIVSAHGGLSPQNKLNRLRELQGQGAVVAMVGDGVNDAPVLAAAQVSLAMGSGTQLAHATADMILLSERLEHLVRAVDKARRTLFIMRENFAWAIGYNLVALPLAAGGWLTPWMSAIGMSFSSLLVVVNALRLRQN